MSFKTSLVDIDKITSKLPRSTFTEEDLERLANLILQLNGIVQPLVVKETAREKYEVLQGDLQFYGALKAWEIDDDFEMIRAFIVNEKEKNLVTEQLDFLQAKNSNNYNKDTDKVNSSIDSPILTIESNELLTRVNNLEKRLDRYIETVEDNSNQKVKQLDTQIEQIKQQLPVKLDLLTAFNTLEKEKLILPLQSAGITNKEIDKIIKVVTEERKKKIFISLSDLMERSKINRGKRKVRLMTENKLIQIIDRWSKIAFYL